MKPFIFTLILFLFSCSTQKVSVLVEVYKPYCGGAKPTPEMAKGSKIPFSNEKIAVYIKNSDETLTPVFLKWIVLDSFGKWKGSLKSGSYNLFRFEKTLSFTELEKKYRAPDNEMYGFVGEEKIIQWKETPDYTLEVSKETIVTITLSEKCFVGLNPCMEYIGPKPP
jgi:hypothetical protein